MDGVARDAAGGVAVELVPAERGLAVERQVMSPPYILTGASATWQ